MIRRRKSVFLTLLLSYFVILFIPVSISAVMYTNMENTMVGNASRSNLAMLEQVRQIMDKNMQEVDQLIVQVATHPKLQTLWTIPEEEKYIQYEEAFKALKNIRTGAGFVSDLYIHLRKGDVILSPMFKTDATTYFTQLYPYADKSLQQVRDEILSGYHFKTFWPVTAIRDVSSSKNFIQCAVSLPLGESNNVWGTLVMSIEDQQIYNLLKQIEWAGSGSMYIIDDQGQVIMSTTGNFRLPEGLSDKIATRSGYQSYSIGNRTEMVSHTTGQGGWKYVSLVPESVVLERVNEIKALALTLLGLAVVLGAIVAYWMANRSYSPIRDMMLAIMNGQKPDKKMLVNEYEFIKSSIAESLAEGKELKQKLEGHLPVVRTYFLTRLLKGQADLATLKEQSLEFMGVSFKHEYVCVALIEVDESSGFLTDHSERDWALLRFVLFNLSSELLGESGYVMETDRNRLALLLNLPDDSEQSRRERDELIEELKAMTEGRFRTKIAVGVSSIRHGLAETGNCYEEALNALDYRIIHGASSLVHFEAIQDKGGTFYHYPMETEAQLMNYVKSGDYNSVELLLDDLYEQNIVSRGMTPEMGKCLFFDLLSTILKVLNALKIDEQQLFGSHDPVKSIAGSSSVESMLHKLKELCRTVCASVREARTDQGERLSLQLKLYIDEHYANHGLSLTSIADFFGMTPQYVSGFFKKQNGENLTDYLLAVRIREAKRMLADPEQTVLQIAQKVGYATDIGFIRVFKKIEGITPGKYRETLLQAGDMKNGSP
ncbi:helix-turn-helix domain-containing protein [Paenibacillus ginsengarvi]|uniref:AraC family transcriptional regulator n=1 Tax=Paenibacillus ginsengarvi TaxID=400777 RepID=A0A3B0CLH7_9BACL|nr:helix-turn-helix domain-containing protein [Paenibacillus ginsengarvi]RKN85830.1 AraC family transcriptional regulator [Paenibacillus ginsengarvi]